VIAVGALRFELEPLRQRRSKEIGLDVDGGGLLLEVAGEHFRDEVHAGPMLFQQVGDDADAQRWSWSQLWR
jgi:hypothetical protein